MGKWAKQADTTKNTSNPQQKHCLRIVSYKLLGRETGLKSDLHAHGLVQCNLHIMIINLSAHNPECNLLLLRLVLRSLVGTALLVKNRYNWVEYVVFVSMGVCLAAKGSDILGLIVEKGSFGRSIRLMNRWSMVESVSDADRDISTRG